MLREKFIAANVFIFKKVNILNWYPTLRTWTLETEELAILKGKRRNKRIKITAYMRVIENTKQQRL